MNTDVDSTPSSRGFIAMLEACRSTGGLAPGNFPCRSLQAHQRGDLGLDEGFASAERNLTVLRAGKGCSSVLSHTKWIVRTIGMRTAR